MRRRRRTSIRHQAIPLRERAKQNLKHVLLQGANIRRIHIIGCARSGTTMLHYAMLAFTDTILHDAESAIWGYPSLRETCGLVRRFALSRRLRYLVTKRHYGWFLAAEVERVLYSVLEHKTFLINIIRDPRDVLTSYKGSRDSFYVAFDRWHKSIQTTEVVLEALRGCPHVLTLRYEDVIGDGERTSALLMERTGLQLGPNITSWAALQDNLALLGQSASRVQALHSVRNFDTTSVGRWRHDPEKRDFIATMFRASPQGELLRQFMATYHYPLDAETLV